MLTCSAMATALYFNNKFDENGAAVGLGVEQDEFERSQARLARDEARAQRRSLQMATMAEE